jgi:hypothetical protein
MPRIAEANVLREITARDFSGGLNVADSELNLSSKYARQLKNLLVGIDGSLTVRQGTKLFADLSGLSDYNICNIAYFATYIIAINRRGEVFAINGQGTVSRIWDSTIAAAKRAGLTIWRGATIVAFLEFNGQLIAMNGEDRPLVITTSLSVDYLADVSTGSNLNVPIGSVCAAFANHVAIGSGYLLNVSERNAAGTWLGDAGAVFVNQFDMRSYVTTGDTTIIGLIEFKNYLLVMFRECIVPVQFVENASATPKLSLTVSSESLIKNSGAISARSYQDIGDMVLSADIVGVPSVGLSTFTRILSPDRPSRFVDGLLQSQINSLSADALSEGVFSVYDRRLGTYVLSVPNNETRFQQYCTCYVYRYLDKLKIESWSTFEGWNWCAGVRSSEGNVFYARNNDKVIFVQGDESTNPLYADYVGEQEMWDDETPFTDGTGWSPVADVADSGVPIAWTWELPWSDLKHRALIKTLRYMILDTEGDQQIQSEVYVDDQFQLADTGEEWTDGTVFDDDLGFTPNSDPDYSPALEQQLIAKDARGFGLSGYGLSPFGGGNNTALRTLTCWPTKFNTMKLRFHGEAYGGPLKFVAITLLYQVGSIRRQV